MKHWLFLLCCLLGLSVSAAANDCTPSPREHVFAEGQRIAYLETGAGKPVLLLHGLFAQKEQWLAVACTLAEGGYRIIAPDLPGFGASQGFTLADHRLDRQADWLHRLSTALALPLPVAVAGNSMGGAIAARYAARHPDSVSSLAFIGGPLGIGGWHDAVANAFENGINPFIPVTVAAFDLEMQLLFAQAPEIPAEQRAALVDAYREHEQHYRRIWDVVALDLHILRDTPAPLQPALILWGDEDRIFPLNAATALVRHLPDARLRVLPTGHLPHLEASTETARHYRTFLDARAQQTP